MPICEYLASSWVEPFKVDMTLRYVSWFRSVLPLPVLTPKFAGLQLDWVLADFRSRKSSSRALAGECRAQVMCGLCREIREAGLAVVDQ